MRIAFITGQLEPGRDGVGDYVRILAAECARRGHAVALVSLAELQPVARGMDDAWPTLRLTTAERMADGGRAARAWLDGFAPEWTSLHFVPYSYHPRGLFAGAIAALTNVANAARRRHIFFHETWIGMGVGASWRERVVGWGQRRAVRALLQRLRPTRVHTSIAYYRTALAPLGEPVGLLPLCGNVPVPAVAPAPAELPGVDPAALVCGMFGTLHPPWKPDAFLHDFAAMAAERGRPAVLAAAGGLGSGADFFSALATQWCGRIQCVALGKQSPERLAEIFARFDFAVSSMPWVMIGKSGSATALREHGLRVVVTRPDAQPRFAFPLAELEPADAGFVPYFRDRGLLVSALGKTSPQTGVIGVADAFLAELSRYA